MWSVDNTVIISYHREVVRICGVKVEGCLDRVLMRVPGWSFLLYFLIYITREFILNIIIDLTHHFVTTNCGVFYDDRFIDRPSRVKDEMLIIGKKLFVRDKRARLRGSMSSRRQIHG